MKETGKSMVEMLGVLAIIGVLSIGGIAGYRMAMSYYKANEILTDVSLRATLVSTDIATNGALIDGAYDVELGNKNAVGNTVTATAVSYAGSFTVTVAGVDKDTCVVLSNQDMTKAGVLERMVNGGADNTCLDTNDISFVFANDLGTMATPDRVGIYATSYHGCDSEAPCVDGTCILGRCVPAADYCATADDCAAGAFCLANKCVKNGCETNGDCAENTANPYCLKFKTGQSSATTSLCVECTDNSHCPDGYYCGGGAGGTGYETTVNRCMKAEIKLTRAGTESFTASDGYTYYLSKDKMPWWDAVNFCKALGELSLVERADVQAVAGTGAGQLGNETNGFTTDGHPVWSATVYSTISVYIVSLKDNTYSNGYGRDSSWHALCR